MRKDVKATIAAETTSTIAQVRPSPPSLALRPSDMRGRGARPPPRRPDPDGYSSPPSPLSDCETPNTRDKQDRRSRRVSPNEEAIRAALFQFSVDMYQQLHEVASAGGSCSENLLFSPLSVQTTLALMLATATGRTADQITCALHLQCCPLQEFQAYMQRRNQKLTGQAGAIPYFSLNNKTQLIRRTPPVTAAAASSQDRDGGRQLLAVLDSLSIDHHSADFMQDAAGVRERTNEWLHTMTAFECEEAIPKGVLDERTTLLVAAVTSLRSADWKWKFPLRDSQPGVFYESSSADPKQVVMMRQRGHFPTADCGEELDATALELRYRRHMKSMVFILPRERDGLASLERALTGPRLQMCLEKLRGRGCVELTLPKFSARQAFDLKDVLPKLGVVDVFIRGLAELPGFKTAEVTPSTTALSGQHFSVAVHCASLQAREKGHKAGPWSDAPRLKFTVDHPFLFLVISKSPEAVLLMGSVRKICLPYI